MAKMKTTLEERKKERTNENITKYNKEVRKKKKHKE